MSEQHDDIAELMRTAELAGPLPEGVEDELWEQSLAAYLQVIGGMGEGRAQRLEVLEPRPLGRAETTRRIRWERPLMVAASLLVIAGVVWAAQRTRDGADPVPPADALSQWVDGVTEVEADLRVAVRTADGTRVRSLDVGLAATTEYLESVAIAARDAAASIKQAPESVADAAAVHVTALRDWADVAESLRADIVAEPDEFVFGESTLGERIDGVFEAEAGALGDTCMAAREAAAGDWDCGAISTRSIETAGN